MRDQISIERRWVRWGLIMGFWTLLGLFFASQTYLVYANLFGQRIALGRALVSALSDWYVWAALAPFILKLARRYPIERNRWFRHLLIHLPSSIFTALLHLVIAIGVLQLFKHAIIYPYSYLESFKINLSFQFHWNVLTYWLMISATLAFDYYSKYRERELKASLLEARLAQAQLQALKMQLHPHFLFNTLHAISALMYMDVDAADRMLTRLSDLLRMTLAGAGAQEVTLKQELEFLKGYLEIEQTRFEDRLTVLIEIEPDTLDARVPNLVLQPLVENAIRHGIAPRSDPGRIEIRARRENGMLQLQVRDDGPGLPIGQAAPLREGIGLANTRARLQQLHGADHRFELNNAVDGGLIVSLAVPFRTDTVESARVMGINK
jgi:two-component system, LytTR family, sensor kinase